MITPSLPPLPAGFLLFGQGPLLIPAAESQMRDVAQWWDKDHPAAGNDAWNIGGFDGLSSESWYALRQHSSIADANGCYIRSGTDISITALQKSNQLLTERNEQLLLELRELYAALLEFTNKTSLIAKSRPAGGGGVGGS